MVFKWRLAAVMADRGVDNWQLHKLTGLNAKTISKLKNHLPRRLDIKTLELLCEALDTEPGELLQRVKDKNVGSSQSNRL